MKASESTVHYKIYLGKKKVVKKKGFRQILLEVLRGFLEEWSTRTEIKLVLIPLITSIGSTCCAHFSREINKPKTCQINLSANINEKMN